MSISARILKFRLGRGLTHQAFADAVGVSRGAVQQWERGTTAPKRKNQPAVAAFMGITEAELMASPSTTPPSKPNRATDPVDIAPAAIKDIADPLMAMAAIYDMLPPEQRRDAVAAATKTMAAFLSQKTFVNHENPASHQDVPEFSHAAIRNKAA